MMLETPNCPDVVDIVTEQDYRLIHPLGHINAFTADTQTRNARNARNAGFRRVNAPVVQFTADTKAAYKREARRILRPLIKRNTQQVFIKEAET